MKAAGPSRVLPGSQATVPPLQDLMLPSGDGHRAALSFVVTDGRIRRIDAIRNPERLRHL